MPTRTPIVHRAPDGQLVVGVAAVVLSLALVVVSVPEHEPLSGLPRYELTWRSLVDSSLDATIVPPLTLTTGHERVVRVRSWATPTPPSWSPNMVAEEHRILASPEGERRAFLLCTAIQVHAPVAVATPEPRPGRLSGHPR